MPRNYYTERLTDEEIIGLFRNGIYRADLETGVITSKHTGKPLTYYIGNEEGYLWVCLYAAPKTRDLSVSHAIWLAGTGCLIPNGFQIHHCNEDVQDNRFTNLIALHPRDHEKLHHQDSIPF